MLVWIAIGVLIAAGLLWVFINKARRIIALSLIAAIFGIIVYWLTKSKLGLTTQKATRSIAKKHKEAVKKYNDTVDAIGKDLAIADEAELMKLWKEAFGQQDNDI